MQLIAMVDLEWGIGKDGKQPIFIKEDLARFKALTTGGTVIMGRKTLEALPGGKPLPDRRNIVLTHDTEFKADGAEVVHSIEELLEIAPKDAFVIGGESIYRQLFPYCDKAYITEVFCKFEADRFFPKLYKDPEWMWTSVGRVQKKKAMFRFDEFERKTMANCEKCLHHNRLIVSENGYHYVCSLSNKASTNCITGKKSHFLPSKERRDTDG